MKALFFLSRTTTNGLSLKDRHNQTFQILTLYSPLTDHLDLTTLAELRRPFKVICNRPRPRQPPQAMDPNACSTPCARALQYPPPRVGLQAYYS